MTHQSNDMQPNFYITDCAYWLLVGKGGWHINELDLTTAKLVRGHFGINDSFAMFASGVFVPPNDAAPHIIAGIDWIRMETKPQINEPPLNIYHYIVSSRDIHGYPVFDCGEKGALAPHWSSLPDLKVYLNNIGGTYP